MRQNSPALRRLGQAGLLLAAIAAPGWGLAGPARAQAPAPADAALDTTKLVPQTGPAFRQVEALGRQIYALDGAAALANAALRQGGIDPQAAGITGWVTEPAANGVLVRFVRQGAQGPEAAFDVTIDAGGGRPTVARRDGSPLTADQAAQFAAVQLAQGRLEQPCSKTYVPVVFRDPGTHNWRVYLLAQPPQPGVFMVGGHHRFVVSADGRRIQSGGRLPPPSCLAGEAVSEGRPAVAMAVAETQVNMPTEMHVYLSLRNRLPLVVLTMDGRRWYVSNGSIAAVRQ